MPAVDSTVREPDGIGMSGPMQISAKHVPWRAGEMAAARQPTKKQSLSELVARTRDGFAPGGASQSIVAMRAFHALMAFLRFEAQSGDRTRF
jgi:hypothetical protein